MSNCEQKYDNQQLRLTDAIALCEVKKNIHKNLTRKQYHLTFIELIKLFNRNLFSLDELKECLHCLLENYRKDFSHYVK